MKFAIAADDGQAQTLPIERLLTVPNNLGADLAESKARGHAFAQAQLTETETFTPVGENVHGDTHYIKRATMAANKRPISVAVLSKTTVPADGASPVTLSRLAPGTKITIDGPDSDEIHAVDGENIAMTFARPGRYTLTVAAPFPSMPKTLTVDAT